ncbi:MAG TPA: hypothetical protein VH277_18865 [Gemmatimonadaceae bacterium]|nr:hypothetical protein [Gemmatimonadaceae bacterium]
MHSIEVSRGIATLYLRETPRREDILDARARCARLPASVRVLRIDLHDVRAMNDAAHDALVVLVRDWRRSRNGHIIVAAGESELTLIVEHGRTRDELAVIRRGTNELDEVCAGTDSNAALMGVFL